MSVELRVLNATIDLAASQRTGESIEWLPFSAILDAFRSVCFELNVSGDLERRCYRLLLLMDADSNSVNEEGFAPTWWEKVQSLPRYMTKLDNHQPQVQFSADGAAATRRRSSFDAATTSSSPIATMPLMSSKLHPFADSRSGRSPAKPVTLRYPQPDDARQFRQPPATASLTSPSVLHEGLELSMILNHRLPTQLPAGAAAAATAASASAYRSTRGRSASPHRLSTADQSPGGGSAALDELADKISSVEKETKNTRNLIAQLAYRKAHASPSSSMAATAPRPATADQRATNRRIHFDDAVDATDDAALPVDPAPQRPQDVSAIWGDPHRLDAHALDSPALSVAATPGNENRRVDDNARHFSALLSPGDQVSAFSKALQSSAAMQRYLQRSAATTAATGGTGGAGAAASAASATTSDVRTATSPPRRAKFTVDDLFADAADDDADDAAAAFTAADALRASRTAASRRATPTATRASSTAPAAARSGSGSGRLASTTAAAPAVDLAA
eukprot:gene12371-8850_t